MATRTKTIEYALSTQSASVATSVVRVFPPLLVYVPETGSRTFRSAFVEINCMDNVSAATSITGWKWQYRIGTTGGAAGTPISESLTSTITNTGENMSFVWVHDVTNVFTTDFSANTLSASFNFGMTITGSATSNACVKLHVTYDYNDIAGTRIKTVQIPMDSYFFTASATGSSGSPGTLVDRIPLLDTYLPEASKTYRDIHFEFCGNDFLTATGSRQGTASFCLDGTSKQGDTGSFGPMETTLLSARYFKYLWNHNSMATSTTHSVWAMSQHVGRTLNGVAAKLSVTYEYDHAASTQIMNCIQLNAGDDSGYVGGTSSLDMVSQNSSEFFIQEPAITMSRCGIYHSLIDSGAVTFLTAVSSGSLTQSLVPGRREFTFPAVVTCGGWMCGTRFDSGATGSQGMGLVRGKNVLVNNRQRSGTTVGTLGSNYTANAILNYESAKSSQAGGDANHSQIRKWFLLPVSSSTGVRQQLTASMPFAESSSNFWMNSLGAALYPYNSLAGSNLSLRVAASGSNEGSLGFGWTSPYAGTFSSDAEIGPMSVFAPMSNVFQKNPGDPDTTKFQAGRTRRFSIDCSNAIFVTGYFYATYHDIAYTLTGSLSGSSGDGSGVLVEFFRNDNDNIVASATSTAGGQFQAVWYDNTIPLYAAARQDDTRVGRSANSTASGAP